ncbi:MAG: restriction endonuclease subunit S [Nostoc sp.]|uniref:restriction endonuclease subunit S n=1 Tax=Nostoc sp. TaxID=1180 RepID=UPI002FF80C92
MREVLVKYEEFKDSPVGRIPKDWNVAFLEDVAEIVMGQSPPGHTYNQVGRGMPLINGPVEFGDRFPSKLQWTNTPTKLCKPKDILFCIRGSTTGRINIANDTFCIGRGVAAICGKEGIAITGFVELLLRRLAEVILSEARGSGSTFPSVNSTRLAETLLLLPPFEEQKKIAEILDTVDEAIARTSSLIIKLKQTKAGLLQDLLTRGLDEDGKLRDPQAHPEQFKDSPLGQIPRYWDIERLESFAEFITSGSRGWAAYYSDEGAMFIRIGNLTREHLNLKLNNIAYVKLPASIEGARARVQAGDLLISATADLGIIGVIPSSFEEAYVNQHIALIRLDQNRINSWWVGNYLSGELGQKKFYQLNDIGAKSGLNLQTIGALLIVVPPIQEQEKIVKIINTYNVRICTEEAYLNKLKLHKQGLMQDLLTGKVRVKNL